MYKKFFGMKELPFRNNLDVNYFYEKASRLEILNALIYVIQRGDAVIKVTGEVGSGKTTLLRLTSLAISETSELIYINAPNLTPKDLLFTIAIELRIDHVESASKHQLLQLIRENLFSHHQLQRNVVVLVDEAQSMSVDTLEELRLLTNLETEKDKLVQLVLFGQQELDVALDKQALRQLKSRITYSIHIPQLTVQDVYDYLNHRMRIADYKGLDLFTLKDAKKIQKLSGGLPRTINAIADQLLMAAFGSGDHQLKRKHYKNINNIQLQKESSFFQLYFFIGVLLTLFIVLVLWLSLSWSPIFSKSPTIVDQSEAALEEKLSITNEPKVRDDLSMSQPKDLSVLAEDRGKYMPVFDQVAVKEETVSSESIEVKARLSQLEPAFSNFQDEMTTLYDLHKETEAWLRALENTRYVIQLSTTTPNDYNRLLQSYSKDKNFVKKVHFMLALNDNETKLVLISLYLANSSYKTLRNELDKLPEDIRLTKPFIVNLNSLKTSAELTRQKLEAMEVR